jgi:hypothetical protein
VKKKSCGEMGIHEAEKAAQQQQTIGHEQQLRSRKNQALDDYYFHFAFAADSSNLLEVDKSDLNQTMLSVEWTVYRPHISWNLTSSTHD